MRGQCTPDFTRRYRPIAIAIVAFAAVSAALLGNGEEPYIFPFAETGAQLGSDSGLVADGAGNLYAADSVNHRIWRIDPDGTITAIAGTGEQGFSGDDGPATEAQFFYPYAPIVDGEGNLYVSDIANSRIRRIDSEGVVTTIAGTGERGFSGDGGPATEAQLFSVVGMALDTAGNLYVSDGGNYRVRRIDPAGIITTIAGTGERGFSGDGGPATEAQWNRPYGMALDGAGNLYVGDINNSRVRRIDPEGIVTTIAGTGERGFSGDGGPATEAQIIAPLGLTVDGADNLYVGDPSNCRIRRIDPEGTITTFAGSGPTGQGCGHGGNGGPATKAQLKSPQWLALDGTGNLYVSTIPGIRVVRPPGERNPVTQEFPQFANGDSTVSDLVLVNVDTKTVTPVVRFYDSVGDPVSADSVVEITEDLELGEDGSLAVKVGIPPLGEQTISTHGQGALTTGSVRVVSDGYTGGVLRFDSMAVGVAGVGAAQSVQDAMFPARRKEGGINTGAAIRNLASEPVTLTCHLMQGGEMLGTTMVELVGGGQQARFINEMFPEADTSDFTGSVRCIAPEDGKFTGVALEMDAPNRVFTTLPVVAVPAASRDDVEVPRIFPVAGTGEVGYGGDGGPATETPLYGPVGLAVDGEGNLYIGDVNNRRVRKVDSTGTITTIAGHGEHASSGEGPATEVGVSRPNGVAVDEAGSLYVSDRSNHRILKLDSTGMFTTVAGTGEEGFSGDGGPATEAQLNRPMGVAVDRAGNLYIADQYNHRIRKVDSTGTMTTVAGTGERGFSGDEGPATEAQLFYPLHATVDGSGKVYVADTSNYRIRRIDAEGVITTFAGTGEWGSSGDGGLATEARLTPRGLAVDGSGNVYVTDIRRIRRIDADGVITTVAGTEVSGFGGDGGPATEAQLDLAYGLALDGAGNLYVADNGNQRIRVVRPPGERNPVNHEFPQFANGGSTVSDLVLVNVDTKTVTPVVRFYGSTGDPISADSLVEVTGDLQLAEDGALTVTAGIPPLGERTISTHGQGALTTGSVRVVSDGYTGGVLRFDNMAVGVAGVGAADPVNDALFPARRKEGGINTGAAIRNLASEAMTLTCHLMRGGKLLETAMVELAASGQQARFINEMFPDADTSDFTGSVRCTAPEGQKFTGVALEMDIGNRIFTTLPLVPVGR